MTGRDAFEAMGGISDKLIMEAGDRLGILNAGVVKHKKDKAPSAFSRFMNSGWGVAAVCTLVAIGVMGGIIWAGNQPGSNLPAGRPVATDTEAEGNSSPHPNQQEETEDVGEGQTEVQTEVQSEGESTPEGAAPVFDYLDSLVAIDQLAQKFSISLKYYATPYNGLMQEFNGSVGQAGGKHWAYANYDGGAVLEDESGYYHTYVYEGSKFWYRETYTMTDSNEFERVYEGRYWWRNYLEELTFDAYDALVYTGKASVLDQDCYVFSFNGTVTDGREVALALYVSASGDYVNQVMKMEVEIIQNNGGSHLSTDVRKVSIEVARISMGDAAKGPTLPAPKWDGPDDGPVDVETAPETQPPEEPETGEVQTPVIPTPEDLAVVPLVSADDTTSYMRIPYLSQGMGGTIEFFILPEGATDTSELVSVFGCGFAEDCEANLLVLGVEKSPTQYCILFVMEKSGITEIDGEEVRYVEMMCTEISFIRDKTLSPTGTTYCYTMNRSSAGCQYTDQRRGSILASKRRENLSALTDAEDLFYRYSKATDYKYTVIYSYSSQSAEELFMAHNMALPEFNFEIFREYGFDD